MEDFIENPVEEQVGTFTQTKKKINSKVYAKVFLYFALALLISGVVAFAVSSLIYNLVLNNPDGGFAAYLSILIIGTIGMVVTSLIMGRMVYKNSKYMAIPYVLYSVFIGAIISGCAFWVESPYTLGAVFLATSVIFVVTGGIGFLLGEKIKFVYMLLIMLVVGSLILAIVNLFILPFTFMSNGAWESYSMMFWILEYVFLAIMILYLAIDMNRIKNVVESGNVIPNNLSLYFSIILLSDFINIFVRLLYIVAMSQRQND